MSGDRRYDENEVRAIIDRALLAQPGGQLSHADLLAVGAGVGLAPEVIERATREVQQARLTSDATARIVSRRRRGFAVHALLFLVLNTVFFLINFLTTPGQWWMLFSVFGWGLALLLHAGLALPTRVSARRLERELRRMAKKSEAHPHSSLPESERRKGLRVQEAVSELEASPDSDETAERVLRRE